VIKQEPQRDGLRGSDLCNGLDLRGGVDMGTCDT
jgi:hypothetical protein